MISFSEIARYSLWEKYSNGNWMPAALIVRGTIAPDFVKKDMEW